MNGHIKAFVGNNWKWLLGVIVGSITFYNTLKATVIDTGILKKDMVTVMEFKAVQIKVNETVDKKLDKMDDKLDKILFRMPRR